MPGQMLLDLALGFDYKAQVRAVAGDAGDEANRKRSCVPKRVCIAGSRAEFGKPLLCPGEMVFLLSRGLRKTRAHFRIACGKRFSLVERLCANFASVIDA